MSDLKKSKSESGQDQSFEVIKPPDTISKRVKLGGPNAVKLEGLTANEEQFVESIASNYLEFFRKDLQILSGAFVSLASAPQSNEAKETIYTASHDIKGQAGSFGFDLITGIADQLCRFIESLETIEKKHLEVIGFHVEAMKIAESKEMKGNGGPAGQKLLEGLRGVVTKVENT